MNPALKKDFRFIMKRRGGRMARAVCWASSSTPCSLTICISRISRHADEMAYQIRDIFVSAGYPLLFDSPHQPAVPHYAR